jgi:FMN phosphatase YigB (HAD superfamily)
MLDSGDVLIRPRGGRWNPRFDFEAVLLRHHPDTDESRFPGAFRAGAAFLSNSDGTAPRNDYHRVMLHQLGIADPSLALLAELDGPTDLPVIATFPEVIAVLSEIRARGLALAMVTDNWGTSETVREFHNRVATGEFFDVIVVSEELGCRKPDPRMFRTASDALGLAPEECFFVDDWPGHVEAAIALGYQGAVLHREGYERQVPLGLPTIRTLDELLTLI